MGIDTAARVRSAQGSIAESARKERREKELEGMAGILPENRRNFIAFDVRVMPSPKERRIRRSGRPMFLSGREPVGHGAPSVRRLELPPCGGCGWLSSADRLRGRAGSWPGPRKTALGR